MVAKNDLSHYYIRRRAKSQSPTRGRSTPSSASRRSTKASTREKEKAIIAASRQKSIINNNNHHQHQHAHRLTTPATTAATTTATTVISKSSSNSKKDRVKETSSLSLRSHLYDPKDNKSIVWSATSTEKDDDDTKDDDKIINTTNPSPRTHRTNCDCILETATRIVDEANKMNQKDNDGRSLSRPIIVEENNIKNSISDLLEGGVDDEVTKCQRSIEAASKKANHHQGYNVPHPVSMAPSTLTASSRSEKEVKEERNNGFIPPPATNNRRQRSKSRSPFAALFEKNNGQQRNSRNKSRSTPSLSQKKTTAAASGQGQHGSTEIERRQDRATRREHQKAAAAAATEEERKRSQPRPIHSRGNKANIDESQNAENMNEPPIKEIPNLTERKRSKLTPQKPSVTSRRITSTRKARVNESRGDDGGGDGGGIGGLPPQTTWRYWKPNQAYKSEREDRQANPEKRKKKTMESDGYDYKNLFQRKKPKQKTDHHYQGRGTRIVISRSRSLMGKKAKEITSIAARVSKSSRPSETTSQSSTSSCASSVIKAPVNRTRRATPSPASQVALSPEPEAREREKERLLRETKRQQQMLEHDGYHLVSEVSIKRKKMQSGSVSSVSGCGSSSEEEENKEAKAPPQPKTTTTTDTQKTTQIEEEAKRSSLKVGGSPTKKTLLSTVLSRKTEATVKPEQTHLQSTKQDNVFKSRIQETTLANPDDRKQETPKTRVTNKEVKTNQALTDEMHQEAVVKDTKPSTKTISAKKAVTKGSRQEVSLHARRSQTQKVATTHKTASTSTIGKLFSWNKKHSRLDIKKGSSSPTTKQRRKDRNAKVSTNQVDGKETFATKPQVSSKAINTNTANTKRAQPDVGGGVRPRKWFLRDRSRKNTNHTKTQQGFTQIQPKRGDPTGISRRSKSPVRNVPGRLTVNKDGVVKLKPKKRLGTNEPNLTLSASSRKRATEKEQVTRRADDVAIDSRKNSGTNGNGEVPVDNDNNDKVKTPAAAIHNEETEEETTMAQMTRTTSLLFNKAIDLLDESQKRCYIALKQNNMDQPFTATSKKDHQVVGSIKSRTLTFENFHSNKDLEGSSKNNVVRAPVLSTGIENEEQTLIFDSDPEMTKRTKTSLFDHFNIDHIKNTFTILEETKEFTSGSNRPQEQPCNLGGHDEGLSQFQNLAWDLDALLYCHKAPESTEGSPLMSCLQTCNVDDQQQPFKCSKEANEYCRATKRDTIPTCMNKQSCFVDFTSDSAYSIAGEHSKEKKEGEDLHSDEVRDDPIPQNSLNQDEESSLRSGDERAIEVIVQSNNEAIPTCIQMNQKKKKTRPRFFKSRWEQHVAKSKKRKEEKKKQKQELTKAAEKFRDIVIEGSDNEVFSDISESLVLDTSNQSSKGGYPPKGDTKNMQETKKLAEKLQNNLNTSIQSSKGDNPEEENKMNLQEIKKAAETIQKNLQQMKKAAETIQVSRQEMESSKVVTDNLRSSHTGGKRPSGGCLPQIQNASIPSSCPDISRSLIEESFQNHNNKSRRQVNNVPKAGMNKDDAGDIDPAACLARLFNNALMVNEASSYNKCQETESPPDPPGGTEVVLNIGSAFAPYHKPEVNSSRTKSMSQSQPPVEYVEAVENAIVYKEESAQKLEEKRKEATADGNKHPDDSCGRQNDDAKIHTSIQDDIQPRGKSQQGTHTSSPASRAPTPKTSNGTSGFPSSTSKSIALAASEISADLMSLMLLSPCNLEDVLCLPTEEMKYLLYSHSANEKKQKHA